MFKAEVWILRCADRLGFRRFLHRSHTAFDRLLHFLESAHLDLAHAFARNAKFRCKIFERDWIIRQTSCFKDAPLAFIENVKRRNQCLMAIVALLALRENALLTWGIIDKPILPLAALAVVTNRRIERGVAAEATVHVDNILLGHAKALGDDLHLIRSQVAFIQRGNFALRLAQIEEEFFLI